MSAILEHQTLIKSRDLAQMLGVKLNTLCIWTHTDKRFRACHFKRGWFSVQALREQKILVTPTTAVTP